MKYFLALLLSTQVHAELLYETDFDSFPTGPNQWAGTDGWFSNDNDSGAQAIDADLIPALQNTASLGFNQPEQDLTFVALNLGYDHESSGTAVIEIDTLLGIEDSTNGRRDDFFLSLYNSSGDRLASIRFDNESPLVPDSLFGFWRDDGIAQHGTLLDFIPGELFNLFISIDLENNTWSADVGGNPLFDNATFTATSHEINFGLISFEWDIDAFLPIAHGDNFLVVGDLFINALTPSPVPDVSYHFDLANHITLSWQTAVGFDDQVQFSTNLITWQNTLPDSNFTGVTTPSTVNYTDDTPDQGARRYYRILRIPAP